MRAATRPKISCATTCDINHCTFIAPLLILSRGNKKFFHSLLKSKFLTMVQLAPAINDINDNGSILLGAEDEDEDENMSEVLMEIQKLENILMEQLDKESSFGEESVDASSHLEDESVFDEAGSCSTLRNELNQVVTPYGHVSQRVQMYEDLQPASATVAMTTHHEDSITTSQQTSNQQETLLSQTTKIKSLLENLERQLNDSVPDASSSIPLPTADLHKSIQTLNNLEHSLQKDNPLMRSSSPKLQPVEGQTPSRTTTNWPDQPQLSSSHMDNHNRLHSIRQQLWGGTPIRGGISPEEDDSMSTVSISAQVSSEINHRAVEEQTCCFPTEDAPETPVQPRDDYFSTAYQSTVSTAYRLDLPDPSIYHYYASQEPATENACCRIPPLEKLLTALKRLEQRVPSCKRRPMLHTFHEEYELADLDLTNPAMMERYKEL
jgi:hypothetical protein